MKKAICLFVMIMLLPGGTALANTVIDTYPSPFPTNITNGYKATAQTFTVPADYILLSYKFAIHPRDQEGDLEFFIYNWVGEGQVGLPLYQITVPWTTNTTDVDIQGINLVLSAGGLYGAVIDLKGYSQYSVYFKGPGDPYTGGHAYWGDNPLPWDYSLPSDHIFRAEFTGGNVPIPAPLFLVGSGLLGILALKRKSGKS